MRHFLFHPLVFYPVAALLAAGVILFGLRPQSWPRAPAPQAGIVREGALVLAGAAFDAPAPDPDQVVYVVRNGFGYAQALRIAVLPNQGEPSAEDTGVRVLLTPGAAALVSGRPALVEVAIRPLPVTTAARLAASLQGEGPVTWSAQPLSPQEQVLRFELPASAEVNAVGLRAVSDYADYNYGVEIARIRITPR